MWEPKNIYKYSGKNARIKIEIFFSIGTHFNQKKSGQIISDLDEDNLHTSF